MRGTPTPTLILLRPILKNTLYIIQFFQVLFQQQRFKQFFQINFYVLAEKIVAANIAEVINLFTISERKISVGEKSTLSV